MRDSMLRRQNRIQPFVEMDITFDSNEIPKWLDRVRSAYAVLATSPKGDCKAQQAVNAIWNEDLYPHPSHRCGPRGYGGTRGTRLPS